MKNFRKVLFSFRSVFVFGICFSLLVGVRCELLDVKMKADADISEFWSMMSECEVCNNTLHLESLTVFVPINAAFQKLTIDKLDRDSLAEYHLVTASKKTNELGSSYTSMNSRLAGSPPLWITQNSGKYHNDIYVNNALLIVNQSNVIGERIGRKGKVLTQILHKIDQVLIPTRSSDISAIENPSAWDFVNHYDSLTQGSHSLRIFKQKIQQNGKEGIFRKEGGHTFLIPIDNGFNNSRANLLDAKTIDGHVIPTLVLFTTPTRKDTPYVTLANGDNDIRVVISFTQEQRKNLIINYVKSHTLFSDSKHTPGVVLAEIVRANIPVKNGVIHLIHKPLMIVDSSIKELLQEKDGGVLSKFVDAIRDLGSEGQNFFNTVEKAHDVTLFAPCNSALESYHLEHIIRDKAKFLDILKLHLVVDNKLYLDTALKRNQDKIYQVETYAAGKKLYFNVATIGNNRTMTVDGGGVNATVIQPDLAAKNGVIHIIDRLLGVPYNTVLDKLRTDPMLSETYYLGSLERFNDQLNDTTKKFTYFVPRNKAWKDARIVMPSAIKKLFMRDFAYHSTVTLQRHLIISSEIFTMERIKQLTNNGSNQNLGAGNNVYPTPPSIELPTIRGSLKLYVEEKVDSKMPKNYGSDFIIHWKGIRIPVYRANVECTNGVIHVIDVPFLSDGDIQVSGSAILKPSAILALVVSTLFVKFVLQ